MNNSGSEDLWLSATGAVVNGGRWLRGTKTSPEAFCSRIFGIPLEELRDGATIRIGVPVRNTGTRAGDETVQLYVQQLVGSVTRPLKELKAFERVTLAAGESKTVSFTLTPETFRMWNIAMQRVVEPGGFEIMVGANSVDLKSTLLHIGT